MTASSIGKSSHQKINFNKLQQDLNDFIAWEKKWEMSFNKSKCYSMSITHKCKPLKFTYEMNDTPLTEVEHYPYLGVVISKDLTWSRHIQKKCNKANSNSMLGLLRRNIHCCPTEVKSIAYKSLVRVCPRLEYCNTVWYPHHKTHISSIEKKSKKELHDL